MINLYVKTIIDIIGIAFLLIIVANSSWKKQGEMITTDQKLFLATVWLTIALLAADGIGWGVDGKTFYGAHLINETTTFLYYIFNPLVAIMWVFYVDYKIFGSEKRIRKLCLFYLVPVVISLCLLLSNFFYPTIYYFDEYNRYHRASLTWLSFALCFCILLFALLLTLKYRNKVTKNNFLPLLLFPMPAFICGIIQIIIPEASFIWISVAFSLTMVYSHVQNSAANTDYMTGLNNRRSMETELQNFFGKKSSHERITGIMMDLDNFKQINDTFGHSVGDNTIIAFAKILASSKNREDILVRFAGDEFVIICFNHSAEDISALLEKIARNTHEYNNKNELPINLSYSVGWYEAKPDDDMEKFLYNVDKRMYENKNEKKGIISRA